MKEIGGYIELDTYTKAEYHTDALALNCGRNCLAYLIEAREIKKYTYRIFCAARLRMSVRSMAFAWNTTI